jgi:hypothetical protein
MVVKSKLPKLSELFVQLDNVLFQLTQVEVLDFLMGYESYLRKRRIQIFHWFITPPSRTYFQGHSP